MNLEFVESGTLPQPGIIGRTVRHLLGLICLYGLIEIARIAPIFVFDPISYLPQMSLMILLALCVFNYVINIGFSKDWHRLPLIVSLSAIGLLALGGYFFTGDASTTILGAAILIWLGYFFVHLGISFVLAAFLATPGCEMRAIPSLIGKVSSKKVDEHHCPVSILSGIDNWEQRLKKSGTS